MSLTARALTSERSASAVRRNPGMLELPSRPSGRHPLSNNVRHFRLDQNTHAGCGNAGDHRQRRNRLMSHLATESNARGRRLDTYA
jgi:hypothetical protein